MKNPFLKERTQLTYVGTTDFGQKRQIGVPMVVNEVRTGSSRRCSSAASSSPSAATAQRPRRRVREGGRWSRSWSTGSCCRRTYALIALGITLIFSIMSLLNFAHGQMFMIGGFMVYYVYGVWGLPYGLGFGRRCGRRPDRRAVRAFFFRRVQRVATREENSMLLAVGTALLLENLALFAFGEKQRGVPPWSAASFRSATPSCPPTG